MTEKTKKDLQLLAYPSSDWRRQLPWGRSFKRLPAIRTPSGMDINIHYYDTEQSYNGKVYLQYWDDAKAIAITTTGDPITVWGSMTAYPLASQTSTEGKTSMAFR